MSKLKISPDLFLEVQELNRFSKFLQQDGFLRFLLLNSKTFGLLEEVLNNGKVEVGTNLGTIKINPIKGIDKYGNFLTSVVTDNIPVPADESWYWLKAKHIFTPEEIGTVSIDAGGNLVGTGTKFTEVLRGYPNFASKIKLIGSLNNTQEYEVANVNGDTNAVLAGSFVNETNLKYAVVGTFTAGVTVPTGNKFIFQYDGCSISLVAETIANTPPAFLQDEEFYIARVRVVNGDVIIEDKRTQFYKSLADFKDLDIETKPNPLVGVESVRWDFALGTRESNLIDVAWALRSTNWTVNSSLNKLTISGGLGGLFKDPGQFTDGDFNGWRVYRKNGGFDIVEQSTKSNSQINLTLNHLNPSNYTQGEEIVIAPNAEEIEIKVRFDGNLPNGYDVLDKIESFNIAQAYGRFKVGAPQALYKYNLQYRYKNFLNYTGWTNFPGTDVTYYSEASFDSYGVLNPNIANHVIKTYTPHATNGFIEVVMNANSFSNFKAKIDLGDLKGVTVREFTNEVPMITLQVGVDKQNQIFETDNLALTTDLVINLSTTGAFEGNEFFIDLVGNITAGEFGLSFHQGYINTSVVGSILKRITPTEFDYMAIPRRKVSLKVIYDGTKWRLSTLETDKARLFKAEVQNTVSLLDFDVTGKGISEEYLGYAVCNGANGTPDYRGKMIIAMDERDTDFQLMGAYGGAKTVTMTEANLVPHEHQVVGHQDADYANGTTAAMHQIFDWGTAPADEQNRKIKTSKVGGVDGAAVPMGILNPYFVQTYIMRVPYVN